MKMVCVKDPNTGMIATLKKDSWEANRLSFHKLFEFDTLEDFIHMAYLKMNLYYKCTSIIYPWNNTIPDLTSLEAGLIRVVYVEQPNKSLDVVYTRPYGGFK